MKTAKWILFPKTLIYYIHVNCRTETKSLMCRYKHELYCIVYSLFLFSFAFAPGDIQTKWEHPNSSWHIKWVGQLQMKFLPLQASASISWLAVIIKCTLRYSWLFFYNKYQHWCSLLVLNNDTYASRFGKFVVQTE